MKTPICNFVAKYVARNALRLHMPGHKGVKALGAEELDITELAGADSLYEAAGIIKESEENASYLFGANTFYSTEGASHCIRAMIYLATLWAKENGRAPLIVAGRNAHKAFITAAALCDCEVAWLYPEGEGSYMSCHMTADGVEKALKNAERLPAAVYITSPDYLGNMVDVAAIATVCHRYGVLLLVDNAHGAYLRFLPRPCHPLDGGADLCCDSAHKTLAVLTGGAYLHVAHTADPLFVREAKNALAMFGSTSPSYLILQSLDYANQLIETYPARLASYISAIDVLRSVLTTHGYVLLGNEALKITISTKPYGYTGIELAEILDRHNIICEFADRDHVVLMLTPMLGSHALLVLRGVLLAIPRREPIVEPVPCVPRPVAVLSPREAAFMPREIIPAAESEGRILAAATVGCPPAVPIVACGERIDRAAVEAFAYYGITECIVVKE